MKKLASLAAALSACAVSANASVITLVSEVPAGPDFAFNYQATVTSIERLDPTATSTFFTVYDIPGFVSATAPAGWTEMTQNTGITPSTINGTLFDSPTLPNVTFMYTGAVIPGLATISGFTILSTDSAINLAGDFTSQSTNNLGASAGTTEQLFGSVAIPAGPAVPEPSTWVMMLLGFAGLGFAFRQSRRRVSLA